MHIHKYAYIHTQTHTHRREEALYTHKHTHIGEKKPKNEGAIPDFVGFDEKKTRLLCLQARILKNPLYMPFCSVS